MNKDYLELTPYKERFEIQSPGLSINNIIIGTPYLDVCGKQYIRNLACPKDQYAVIEYFKRGWSTSSYQRVQGEIFSGPKQVAYRIEGKWSDTLTIVNVATGEREVAWTKEPYPENYQYMYGMTRFLMQMNYLPNTLRPKLPPTDSRLRPDQRALENGDFKVAADLKNMLEEKQRAIRRYHEKFNIHPKPAFFDEWKNPDDPENLYYKYNRTYFERDRKNGDWSRLKDIFSAELPREVEEFEKS